MQVRSLLLVVFLGLVAGCGANQRQNTIKTTLVAFNAARDGFLEWDDKHQDATVAKAATGKLTKDEAKKALDTYRKHLVHGVKATILSNRTITLAAYLFDIH